ncbi:hypothetical protein GC167_08145 [bacterium]|nr:hypothetical protein [bacterium]
MSEMFEGFGRRSAFFAVGLTLGSILAYFFFGSRDIRCSYFPNDRVLYDLSKKRVVMSPADREEMRAAGIDSSDVAAVFRSGKVDFKKSRTDLDSCREYFVVSKGSEPNWHGVWANCDSVARLVQWGLE